jgi:hypothetical protein
LESTVFKFPNPNVAVLLRNSCNTVSHSMEFSICTILRSINISIEIVEGDSPSRVLRYYKTSYSVSLPGIREFESLGKKVDNYGRQLADDEMMKESVEGRPAVSSCLERIFKALKKRIEEDNSNPMYAALQAITALFWSIATFGTGDEFFKFLGLFKIIVEKDFLVGAQIISLFLPKPKNNSELRERVDFLFKMVKLPRSRRISLDDYLGHLASTTTIVATGFAPEPLFFGLNGNGVFVANPISFGEFAQRTVFQPHGTQIHNIGGVSWQELLKAGILKPRVYEEFDCSSMFEEAMLLIMETAPKDCLSMQQTLRKESKKYASQGEFALALSYRVAADIAFCCEMNTSMVDTGLLLKINPAGKPWDHEKAVHHLLSKI